MADGREIDRGTGTRRETAAGRCAHRPGRTAAVLFPVMAAMLVVVGGCGTGNDGASTAAPSASASSATTTGQPSSTSPDAADPTTTTGGQGDAQVVEIRVAGGQVQTPQRRVRVPLGTMVELRVQADVSDEVHLHGYDRAVDVTPAKPAVLRFRADVAGVFEVELERAHRQLVQLQVQ